MTQFAILIYARASTDQTGDTADAARGSADARAEHDRHAQELEEMDGTMRAAFALQPSAQAKSVRGTLVTDGPYVESREVVAGLYVVDVPDMDAAVALARRNPATWQGGGLEVREVEGSFIAPRNPSD